MFFGNPCNCSESDANLRKSRKMDRIRKKIGERSLKYLEIWDVYDEKRNLTGRTIIREKSWGNEKYHLIVHVGIFDRDGRMLIQKRQSTKAAWPDLWDVSSGGSALAGEENWQAAERETYEELGLKINLAGVRPHFSINYERGFDDFFTVIMDAASINPDEMTLQQEEVSMVRWASLAEVREMIKTGEFTPYFPGILELLWQVRDNYDGAICQG